MAIFRSRMNHNRQMTVVAVVVGNLLIIIILRQRRFSIQSENSVTEIIQTAPMSEIDAYDPSRPSSECQLSKRDPSMDNTASDKDAESNTETKEGFEGQSPNYESDKIRNSDNFDTDFEYSNRPPTSPNDLPLTPAIFATVLFVSFWPLLALLRSTASPIDGFDIDMFMALKGIMDPTPMDNMDPTSIVELPSLSPAEQLVGAIFGPPR
eukprot:CAMPEP_0116118340 /NCGR_PEP_ID=MMETSP0329-20121206/2050_1 /TAXON_ID=697910 /ORGANISM="Pseudo-nitzschia arenysensis, Strain B593" /LENGTH=208 /DNA_ID=CAMNT_0003611957 /DNA_START=86 /DNA_END=713 /DNA_ORIENTATION=+